MNDTSLSNRPSELSCIKIPRYSIIPTHRLGHDSAADEQLPTETPLRRLSTKAAPRIFSGLSHSYEPDIASTAPLSSRELRASIVQLESLIHEAARLEEFLLVQGQQETSASQQQTPQINTVEYDEPVLEKIKQSSAHSKTLQKQPSALSSARTTKRSIKSVTSLPTVKALAATPILTLPEIKSVGDLTWTPKSSCTDHEPRHEDIQEHLHDWACPDTRRPSRAQDIGRPQPQPERQGSNTAAGPLLNLDSAQERSAVDMPSQKLRFAESMLGVPDRISSKADRKWRKPSMAPPTFVIEDEQDTDATESSPSEPTGTPPMLRYDEPLPVSQNAPTVMVNGQEVDD